ncbi:MAG: SprT family zinc-dependent metalloprotease [Dorea sp.]|nr:SprT family zinc-dependent metalloprotease [Dorea sp.]
MMGAETFKNVERLSERRFENCQLGKLAEGRTVNLKAEVYDLPLTLNGEMDVHKLESLISRYEKTAEHFEQKGKREWAYAKNGWGGEHYAQARDAFDRAERNREKANALKEYMASGFNDSSVEESVGKYSFNEQKECSETGGNRKEKLSEKEQLMPEILNPESKFDFQEFDFESKGLERSLEYFARPDWDGLSVEDKKRIVSSYMGELTLGLDISKMPKVDIRQMPESYYGAYKEKENIIDINSRLLDNPKELANTIAHEMRHAYQYERAKMGETHLDKLYGLNFENYIRPVKDENGNWICVNEYKNQLIEAEAEAFAEKIADMMEGMR